MVQKIKPPPKRKSLGCLPGTKTKQDYALPCVILSRRKVRHNSLINKYINRYLTIKENYVYRFISNK